MNLFNYIENQSNKIGNYLGKDETEDDKEVYSYAIFGILSQIFTFGTGIIVASLFGYFIPFLLVIFSFIILRIGGGGFHCSSFRNCYILSLSIFFFGTILSIVTKTLPNFMFLVSIFCGIYILPVCPKPSKNSPSRGYNGDIKFRKKYRNALLFLLSLSMIFIYFKVYLYSTAISSGILIASFMIGFKMPEIVRSKSKINI